MEIGKLNAENLDKSTPLVLQYELPKGEVERLLLDRFQRLEEEMREHYKWCKIKLHLWGAVLLLLLVLK